MPRTEVPLRTITKAGYTPTALVAGDLTNGNVVKGNNGAIWLEAKNTGVSPYTLTVNTPGTVEGNPIGDKVYTLAASAELRVGPFSQHAYGNDIEFNVNNVAITVAAYQLSQG